MKKMTGLMLLLALLFAPLSSAVAGTQEAVPEVRAGEDESSGARAYYQFSLAKMAQRRREFAAAIAFLKEAGRADPASATIHAELAWTYLTVRDYPAAEEAAKAALALQTDHALAHRVLAQLYYSRARRGIEPDTNRSRAMKELEASLTGSEEDDPEVLLTLGRFYFEGGDYARAARVLQQYAESQSNPQLTPLFLLARTQIQLEEYGDAEQTLARILEGAPESLQALETMVKVLQLQERYADSLPYLQRLLALQGGDATIYKQMGDARYRTGDFKGAAEMFDLALREEPGSTFTLYYLSLSEEQLGRFEKAREHLQMLLEREPQNAEVLFRLARLDEREGDLAAALGRYRGLVKLLRDGDAEDPRRADLAAFCARAGVMLMELRRYSEAVSELQSCREDGQPGAETLSLLLSRSLVHAGKGEKALGEVGEATRRFPGDLRFPVQEAEILLHLGRDSEAEARLAALRQSPGMEGEGSANLDMQVSDAYFNAGTRAERRDDLARAEELLRQAIDWNPRNGPALNYLGYTWAEKGKNLEEAVTLLLRAVDLDPENGAYLDSLGWAYYRLGRHAEARTFLLRAAALVPRDAAIQDHLGDLEAAQGNGATALRYWEKAIDLGGDEDEAIRRKMRAVRKSASQ